MSIKEGQSAIEMARQFQGEVPTEPTLIVVESPYRSDDPNQLGSNIELAMAVCRYAMEMGYNPFASHLYYPVFLDDNNKSERAKGIASGFAWGALAKEVWFIYRKNKLVMTEGMIQAYNHYLRAGKILRHFMTADEGKSLQEFRVAGVVDSYE